MMNEPRSHNRALIHAFLLQSTTLHRGNEPCTVSFLTSPHVAFASSLLPALCKRSLLVATSLTPSWAAMLCSTVANTRGDVPDFSHPAR